MKNILITTSILILLLLISGCTGSQTVYLCKDGSAGGGQEIISTKVTYFCPDGKKAENYNECTFERVLVTEKKARNYAENFLRSSATVFSAQSSIISVYQEQGQWYAQGILSKRDVTSIDTLLKIDGVKGIVTCVSNCAYLNSTELV